jgi:hypothetical protein
MMGNEIVVSPDPKGNFAECVISGTPKPGTCMQIKASTAADGSGRFTYEVYAPGTDGLRRAKAILLPNHLFGKTAAEAYADGDRGFLYFPLPGDELNLRRLDVAGTGDDLVIGDRLIIDTGTGKLIKTTGSPGEEPFTCLEAVTDPTTETLIHVLMN